MKKIMTSLSSALLIFFATLSFTSVAKSAEFFTIGTGGPTGVYFQTGNAICKMLHKSAISKEHGKKVLLLLIDVLHHQQVVQIITLVKLKKVSFNLV
jgi:hypothetical protein